MNPPTSLNLSIILNIQPTNGNLDGGHLVAGRLALDDPDGLHVVDQRGQLEHQRVPDHVLLRHAQLGRVVRVGLDLRGKLELGREDQVRLGRPQKPRPERDLDGSVDPACHVTKVFKRCIFEIKILFVLV